MLDSFNRDGIHYATVCAEDGQTLYHVGDAKYAVFSKYAADLAADNFDDDHAELRTAHVTARAHYFTIEDGDGNLHGFSIAVVSIKGSPVTKSIRRMMRQTEKRLRKQVTDELAKAAKKAASKKKFAKSTPFSDEDAIAKEQRKRGEIPHRTVRLAGDLR